MASYIIGDLHGCFDELTKLLDLINFDKAKDRLFFTGDLVNGATKSVAVLEFIKSLGDDSICVLGNHDLTLLALDKDKLKFEIKTDGFNEVLNYPRKIELLEWLIKRPLVYFDQEFNFLLVHAGLYPFWSIAQVCSYAKEVEEILASNNSDNLLGNMFGNLPERWNDSLSGWDRIRFIINACTRMRFCRADGSLELDTKGIAEIKPMDFVPWYEMQNQYLNGDTKVIFGHWSALAGVTNVNNIIALDTGCIWGNSLTALRLEDNKKFAIACPKYCTY